MLPLEKKYIFQSSQTAESAIKEMREAKIEFGLVLENQQYIGTIKLNQLYVNSDKTLSKLSSEVPAFKPDESVTVAMNIMKNANNFIGVVMESKPIGILLANELLTRLI